MVFHKYVSSLTISAKQKIYITYVTTAWFPSRNWDTFQKIHDSDVRTHEPDIWTSVHAVSQGFLKIDSVNSFTLAFL